MAIANGLGVWRFVARVARELSEAVQAKVRSWQLVQWMERWRSSVALHQWPIAMVGAKQVGGLRQAVVRGKVGETVGCS